MDIIDGRNMELLNKLRLNPKSPIFPGLDLCLHVRLDLEFWCLSWRGLANTWWPVKACWPAGRTLARDLGRRWHEWQSWGVHNQAGLDNRTTGRPTRSHSGIPQPCLDCTVSAVQCPPQLECLSFASKCLNPLFWVIKMFTA